jgi:hypothetical protein
MNSTIEIGNQHGRRAEVLKETLLPIPTERRFVFV